MGFGRTWLRLLGRSVFAEHGEMVNINELINFLVGCNKKRCKTHHDPRERLIIKSVGGWWRLCVSPRALRSSRCRPLVLSWALLPRHRSLVIVLVLDLDQ